MSHHVDCDQFSHDQYFLYHSYCNHTCCPSTIVTTVRITPSIRPGSTTNTCRSGPSCIKTTITNHHHHNCNSSRTCTAITPRPFISARLGRLSEQHAAPHTVRRRRHHRRVQTAHRAHPGRPDRGRGQPLRRRTTPPVATTPASKPDNKHTNTATVSNTNNHTNRHNDYHTNGIEVIHTNRDRGRDRGRCSRNGGCAVLAPHPSTGPALFGGGRVRQNRSRGGRPE
jgi:hypothetical protein